MYFWLILTIFRGSIQIWGLRGTKGGDPLTNRALPTIFASATAWKKCLKKLQQITQKLNTQNTLSSFHILLNKTSKHEMQKHEMQISLEGSRTRLKILKVEYPKNGER